MSGEPKAAWAESKEEQDEYAVLKLPDGREHKIKMLKPKLGEERFLDIRDLHAKTGGRGSLG